MKEVFLLLYLLIGLVPIFEAVDRSSTQLLYLQIVNGVFIFYFLFFLKKENKITFVKHIREKRSVEFYKIRNKYYLTISILL
jgi:negative regulator of genetic competence, sporulation and motility